MICTQINEKMLLGFVISSARLDPQDTLFLFINEALTWKDFRVAVFTSSSLSSDGTVAAAEMTEPVSYRSRKSLQKANVRLHVRDFAVVFLKQDPPVDPPLERLMDRLLREGVPTVNDPRGIRTMGTKAYLKHFPAFTPPTFYVHGVLDALRAIRTLGNCVIKKSDGFGGKNVRHIQYKEGTYFVYSGHKKRPLSEKKLTQLIRHYLEQSCDRTVLVAEYLLSAPRRGDKRVVVLSGRILGSYIRLPDATTGRCACANNGAKRCDPTARDRAIVRALRPHLQKHGIHVAALDLLVSMHGIEYLSEINVVNPGFCNLDVVHPEIGIARRVMRMVRGQMRRRRE